MKIFYTGVRREGYDQKRRDSFEYINFYSTFKGMAGVETIEFPFDRILEVGKKKFNEELLEAVKREKPDMLFAFMYTDELDSAVLMEIKKYTKTVAWFADDYWRFWNYSRRYALYFSYVVTTLPQAVGWYKDAGITNVIESQWACPPERLTSFSRAGNTDSYKPLAKDIDVSFVGQYKPARARIIQELAEKGIIVECFGFGWKGGKLTHEEMLKVFSRSKINLNLNVRPSRLELAVLARIFLKKSIDHLVPDFHLFDNLRAWWHFAVPHTHARPFELAGCKAFTISGLSEGIERFYEPDKEMAFYEDANDLAEKIRYYLSHDAEREGIAQAGYERTLREHTYPQRFKEIFQQIGLPQ